MKGFVAVRGTVGTPINNDNTGTTITSGAYVQLTASLSAACSAIEVQNTSTKIIQIAVGGSGAEVVKYVIAPGVNSVIIPIEIKKASRLTAKAVTADATTGALVINFLG